MDNFEFHSPTFFSFGRDMELKSGEYIKKFGGSRVLIHYGGSFAVKSGLIERIEKTLTDEGLFFVSLGGAQPNPRSSLVYKGIEVCRENSIDFILGVGGGSAIDSAKAIAMGTLYDGDFWDFYSGKATPKKAIPVGTVLTIAAAGSEGSPSTVITRDEGMLKRGCTAQCVRPVFSIMNPALTCSVSAYQTASGATDIMAHVFERYFTNTRDVEVTDRLCEAVLLTIISQVPRVLENPNDYAARANIMWAGMVAHNDICGVGRSQDWNSHQLEHELSALYDCAHGAGLAVIMPAWMKYVMKHDVMRFAQAAVRIWGCEMDFSYPEKTAKAGINAFKNFLSSIGMPTSFSELDARVEDIPLLLDKLNLGDKGRGGFVSINRKAAEEIYKIAAE